MNLFGGEVNLSVMELGQKEVQWPRLDFRSVEKKFTLT